MYRGLILQAPSTCRDDCVEGGNLGPFICSPVAKNKAFVIEHVIQTRAPFSNPFDWSHMLKHSSNLPYFAHDSGISPSMNLNLGAKRSAEPATGTCAT